jgi:hypothetical protein
MIAKYPIDVHRVRKVPKQFNWVDHRLVGDRHIDNCSLPAAALYLFLVTVSDAKGLNYYSDRSICSRLSMDPSTLAAARANLIEADLIAYKRPLYQVLSLVPPMRRSAMDRPLSLGDILKKAAGGGP